MLRVTRVQSRTKSQLIFPQRSLATKKPEGPHADHKA